MRSPGTAAEVKLLAGRGWRDRDIAEWLGVPRRTVCDLRRRDPATVCPRCWRRLRDVRWVPAMYAELLGFYLGDGHICRAGRTGADRGGLRVLLAFLVPLPAARVRE